MFDRSFLEELNAFFQIVAFPLCEEVEFFRRHAKQLGKFVARQVLLQNNTTNKMALPNNIIVIRMLLAL